MDQQKPRDNSMYHLSDRTNLKSLDKALNTGAGKYQVFSHKMLTHDEIKLSKTMRMKSGYSRTKRSEKDDAISEIWQSFTVPLKFRIPARRKSGKSRPSHSVNRSTI